MAENIRFLTQHKRKNPKQILSELSEFTKSDAKLDVYGTGDLISNFEKKIAELLGKESAVFMPSGTMAQQIALRIYSDWKNISTVAFHPLSHLEVHEQNAYSKLHNLDSVLVGESNRKWKIEDFQKIETEISTLLVELPQREIGGQLPTWEELTKIFSWAKEKEIALHLDGARLWECKPFYQKSYAEICEPFDSVYVSFYKILGGIAGAILAGSEELIKEAKIWQRRHGGNLISLYPYVLSSQKGLEEHLPQIDSYVSKAQEIAKTLSKFPELELIPNSPQTNMFHLYLNFPKEKLELASKKIIEEDKIQISGYFREISKDEKSMFEFTVGSSTLNFEKDEIESIFRKLIEIAKTDSLN
ncbi:MAG: aminotransferase class I/II-fold pyridoxal phosphate-dependent enzyme [Calditrichaeota bacterium]|nr:MAG: aminotransferase class I/II-fold pyridoxal phosphate-dependent enzyme [Calditrichota bacterium]